MVFYGKLVSWSLESVTKSTYLFLDDNLLELAIRGRNQLILGQGFPAQEDIEHQLNTLEAQQIISVTCLSLPFNVFR